MTITNNLGLKLMERLENFDTVILMENLQKIDMAHGTTLNNLTDAFDPAKQYQTREYCIKDNVLYKFISTKEAGDWDDSVVVSTTISNEMKEMNATIAQLNSKLGYQDITDQITVLDSALAGTIRAYAESGTVLIRISLRAGIHGAIAIAKINEPYAPRERVNGSYSSISTAGDAQKLLSSSVETNGNISVWLAEDLLYSESVTFVYPLKNEITHYV